jgi:excisionase family DNA binding protein
MLHTIPTLLNVEDVSDALKISPHTVRKWASVGKLPRVKLGTRTLFDADDVARLIQEARHGSNSERRTRHR